MRYEFTNFHDNEMKNREFTPFYKTIVMYCAAHHTATACIVKYFHCVYYSEKELSSHNLKSVYLKS
jgi:hypothetical protein